MNTTSEIISFTRKLEERGAAFYEGLAGLHQGNAEAMHGFAGENRKNITQVERAYYGVVSDALEGCFAFDIDPDAYVLPEAPDAKTDYREAIAQALNMEEVIIRFYRHGAEQSTGLMADIPRTFTLLAKKRERRLKVLQSLVKT
jgi:rubrerythrin